MNIKKKLMVFVLPLSAVLLLGGGLFYVVAQKTDDKELAKANSNFTIQSETPPPLTTRQQQQLQNQTSTATKEKVFDIVAGNYFFSPNTITVNQGDKVSIVFINLRGTHNLILDQLNVRTPIMQKNGQFVTANFTADQKGTYTIYSNLPQDSAIGMKGTLTVQ